MTGSKIQGHYQLQICTLFRDHPSFQTNISNLNTLMINYSKYHHVRPPFWKTTFECTLFIKWHLKRGISVQRILTNACSCGVFRSCQYAFHQQIYSLQSLARWQTLTYLSQGVQMTNQHVLICYGICSNMITMWKTAEPFTSSKIALFQGDVATVDKYLEKQNKWTEELYSFPISGMRTSNYKAAYLSISGHLSAASMTTLFI